MSTLAYLKSFFKDKDVASVTPTSKFCVRHVCEPMDFSNEITVLEYGAGTGVFSEYLLERMTSSSKLFLFETNRLLFDKLKEEITDSRVSFYDQSVERAMELLSKDLIGEVDYIISGIPFSFLDKETTLSILEQSYSLLHDDGKFLAYQTSGHLKDPLREVFGNVSTEFEILNLPPMTVYEAVKRS